MKLELDNFEFGYSGRYFFKPFDFTFKKNNIYILAGGNGSGKTTFLNTLAFGKKDREKKLPENITYFIQFFNDIFYCESVKKEIMQKKDETFYLDTVNKFQKSGFDFKRFEKTSPFDLDFVNQKKLAIILTLINDKKILFLDEFDSRLSLYDKLFFCDYLQKIKRNKIIIIVSHSNMIINKIADSVIYFDKSNSQLKEYGSSYKYFNKIIINEDDNKYIINKDKIVDFLMREK